MHWVLRYTHFKQKLKFNSDYPISDMLVLKYFDAYHE